MVDIFPPRGMPGQVAENWARAAENRVISLEQAVTTLGQNSSGDNRSLASQLDGISKQVADLSGRVGYTTDGTGISQVWTTDTTTPYVWGVSVSFTLGQARVVSIQSLIAAEAYVQANNNSSYASAYAKGAIFVDGVLVSGSRGIIATNVGIRPDSNRGNFTQSTIISRSLISLQKGAHTVSTGFYERGIGVYGSPASGSATVTTKDPSIFVDVLQPVG